MRSEVANVYEVGFHGQPVAKLSYSITIFHADYDFLRTASLAPSHTAIVFSNDLQCRTSGLETWGTYQAASFWRLSTVFTRLSENLPLNPARIDPPRPLQTSPHPTPTSTL